MRRHSPEPTTTQTHHVLPKSWGGGDEPENLVPLCGTGHDLVHDLLNHYRRHEKRPPWSVRRRYPKTIRRLAAVAWRQRPGDRPPWTASSASLTRRYGGELA